MAEMKREWWVHSVAAHRSRVGPFTNAIEAAHFAEEYRPAEDGWRKVSIISRIVKS
jgi:hypothetical protein